MANRQPGAWCRHFASGPRVTATVLLALALGLQATLAHAEPAPDAAAPSPFGRRFAVADYVGTGLTLALYYTVHLGLDGPRGADWTEPVPLLDAPTRGLVRLRSAASRTRADALSTHLRTASAAYPVALSLVAPVVRGWAFADIWQLGMMNLQVFAAVSLAARLPHKLLGRVRPNSTPCIEDRDFSIHCRTGGSYVSFFGGHTAVSMAGAGLACAHHQHAALLGDPWADALGCTAAIGAASAVFVLRLQADKHWLSDQLVATAVGFGLGYGLPTLLYYHPIFGGDEPGPERERRSALIPLVTDQQLGAGWFGIF